MAKILRPRRGLHSYATSQNIKLAKGEIFFSYTGTTPGENGSTNRIYMGDGNTSFSSLKPFISNVADYAVNASSAEYSTNSGSANYAGNAISTITRSSNTFTAKRFDGSSFTFTQQNTTYPAMTAAEINTGTVTATRVISPKILKDALIANNTTYDIVSSSAAGLAPAGDSDTTKYLRSDGSWQVPPDTTYSKATTSSDGLLTKLYQGATTVSHIFLAGDNTWKNVNVITDGLNTVTSDRNGIMTPNLLNQFNANIDNIELRLNALRQIYYISTGNTTNAGSVVNNYTRLTSHDNTVSNSSEHVFLVTGELVVNFAAAIANAYGFITLGLASGNAATYGSSSVTELITVPATKSGYVRYNICRQISIPGTALRLAYTKHLDTSVATTVSAAVNIIDIGQYGTLTQN